MPEASTKVAWLGMSQFCHHWPDAPTATELSSGVAGCGSPFYRGRKLSQREI